MVALFFIYRNENDFNQPMMKAKSRKLLEDVVRML